MAMAAWVPIAAELIWLFLQKKPVLGHGVLHLTSSFLQDVTFARRHPAGLQAGLQT